MQDYLDITDQLDMYCCPRCMAVDYGDAIGWECVIVDDVTEVIDAVCPRCVTSYDLGRPELAERVAELDAMLLSVLP